MKQPLSDGEKLLIAGYILGDLDVEESQELERLLLGNLAAQEELQAMQTCFQLLPHALAKEFPPDRLQDRVMEASGVSASPLTLPSSIERFPMERSFWRRNVWSLLMFGATILTALFLGVENVGLRQRLSLAQQDREAQRVAAILQKPTSRLVALKGEGNKTAAGTLLFTPGQWKEVIVSLGNLPPLPPEQVYRMWLSLENNQTLLCGEFNTNTEGSVFVRLTPAITPPKGVKATGIFVTIDGMSSSPKPTGQRVIAGTI